MAKIDFKKELKHLYLPSAKAPSVVRVPALQFLMIDGRGNPNTSPVYSEALEALFTVSYTLKFAVKKGKSALDYGVMPLEGLWWAEDMSAFTSGDKESWQWTMMILQPDFISAEMVGEAKAAALRKKDLESIDRLRRVYGEIFRHGWKVSRTYPMQFASEAWQIGDPRVVKLRSWNPWLFGPGSTLLDITIIYRHRDAYWWEMAKKVCSVEADYLDQHTYLQFGGRQVRVPSRYEAYLTRLYGDWKTPDRTFHHDQFGTIIGGKSE